MRTYHLWYHGQPQADAVPFATIAAARRELHRQLDAANQQGEYPTAVIVSIGKTHHDVRIEDDYFAILCNEVPYAEC